MSMDVLKEIAKSLKGLPDKQKQIGQYFIDNFDRIPFLSIDEIAQEAKTSKASIVRFAQNIGVKGFYELKDGISKELQKKINDNEIVFIDDDAGSKRKLYQEVVNIEINNIYSTFKNLNEGEFEDVIKDIITAKTVLCAGLGLSHFMASILQYELSLLQIDARNLNNNLPSFIEQIKMYDENDVVVAFSFPPYSNPTIELAKYCRMNNIKLIGVTNKLSSPIITYAYKSLIVKTENVINTNSSAAVFVLINAITTSIAKRLKLKK